MNRRLGGTLLISAIAVVGVVACVSVPRVHTVIITVPEVHGFLAAWKRPVHPDAVEVSDGVARFSIPQSGVLRVLSMSCLEDWVDVRFVDEGGQPVDDARLLGTAAFSRIDGTFWWFYRGPESDLMHSSAAKRSWLYHKGIK